MAHKLPKKDLNHRHTCTCPACGTDSQFTYIGEQHWPEAVARRRGVASITLWECGACGSSVDGVRLSGNYTSRAI